MPRKTQPRKFQPPPPLPPWVHPNKLNEYSSLVTALLVQMVRTSADANDLLQDLRRKKNARRMFLECGEEALIASKNIAADEIILELNGHVALSTEVERPAGGGNSIFQYNGLTSKRRDAICIDTSELGNDVKVTRRSCEPNCVLKHILGTDGCLGIMVVATKSIRRDEEVTLPFDCDWKDSVVPLRCVKHKANIFGCPLERSRLKLDIEVTALSRRGIGEQVTARENEAPVQQTKELSQQRLRSKSCVPKSKDVSSTSTSAATAMTPVASQAKSRRRLPSHPQPIAPKTPAATITADRNIVKRSASRRRPEMNDQNTPAPPPRSASSGRAGHRKISSSATASAKKAPLANLRLSNNEETAAGTGSSTPSTTGRMRQFSGTDIEENEKKGKRRRQN